MVANDSHRFGFGGMVRRLGASVEIDCGGVDRHRPKDSQECKDSQQIDYCAPFHSAAPPGAAITIAFLDNFVKTKRPVVLGL